MRIGSSIKNKLIVVILTITLVAVIITISPAIYFFSDYTDRVAQNQAVVGMEGLNNILEDRKQQALSHALLFAGQPGLVQAVGSRNTAEILGIMGPLLKNTKVDFVTVTDGSGIVLARSHEPNKFADSVATQANIATALKGSSCAVVESGTVVKLSACAGVPVKNNEGKVIGVISVGYDISRDDIVDAAKNMFHTDVTLFFGDTRVATTISKDGNRVVGTKLNEQIAQKVLNEGQRYTSKADILGVSYITAYMPLMGPDNKPIGVIFAGQPVAEAAVAKNKIVYSVGCITLLVLFLAFLVTAYIARKFTEPINRLLGAVDIVAAGNLTYEVTADSNDEIGLLAANFNKMVEQLKGLVTKVNDLTKLIAASMEELRSSSENAANVSRQIAQTISEVSSGAQQQSQSINETSAVVEEMSASIEEIAANANQSANVSDNTAQAAGVGSAAIAKAISQIAVIEKTVSESVNLVAKLAMRSEEIGRIVSAISSITSQTNLLALNAAIEAAHAGEHGKGFAVVAEEVRKLAEQSQKETDQVAELIAKVQEDTSKAVAAMNLGNSEVKTGAEVVNAAGEAFERIAELIKDVSAQVREISAGTQQMAGGSQVIVSSVREIDYVSRAASEQTSIVSTATEEQLASMEEIAEASKNLAQLTQDLHNAVSFFKV